MLKGYKTYIVAALAALGAIGAYLYGEMTLPETAQAVLTAVLSATIRNGIR